MSAHIRFLCPTCKAVMDAPVERAGNKINCLKCGQRLQIPPAERATTILAPALGLHKAGKPGPGLRASDSSLPTAHIAAQPPPMPPMAVPATTPTTESAELSRVVQGSPTQALGIFLKWLWRDRRFRLGAIAAAGLLALTCICWLGISSIGWLWPRVFGSSGAEYFGSTSDERKTFDVIVLGPFGNQIKGVAIVSNRGKETIDGKTYYKTVMTFDGIPGSQPQTSYDRLGADGVYSRKSTAANAPETLEFPLPPTVGRKWLYTQDDINMEMQVAAIEDFDTANKTYKRCLKVIGNGEKGAAPIELTSYYAPKLGLVFMSMRGPGFGLEIKLRE